MKKCRLEKEADMLLKEDLKAKIKVDYEYPFLSDSQMRRIRRREIGFGGIALDKVTEGQFYRTHPCGRPYNKLPKGERSYFYVP